MEIFIEKVREYVFLYDTSHSDYKNLLKKAEAWGEIAAELGMTSQYWWKYFLFAFQDKCNNNCICKDCSNQEVNILTKFLLRFFHAMRPNFREIFLSSFLFVYIHLSLFFGLTRIK